MSDVRDSSKPPALLALRYEREDGGHGHEVWCWWCETTHHHGSGGGNRGAHCCDHDGRSPLASTGYELSVVGRETKGDPKFTFPGERLAGRRPFWRSAELSANQMRKAVIEAIFAKRPRGEIAEFKLSDCRIVVSPWGWNSRDADDRYEAGDNLLSLIPRVFDIPPGVAAVRVLEAATGAQLDAGAALDLQAVIDDWFRRGVPKNEGRRV